MNLPDGWQLVFGVPVYGVGDACVVLLVDEDGDPWAHCHSGGQIVRDDWADCEAWSPEHFQFGEAMLKSHLESRRKQITEAYRSEVQTVFRRADGREWAVMTSNNNVGLTVFGGMVTREEAEKIARERLQAVE